ncbi:RusA family crossover junction endodeoxyribonuclease [Streptomyces bottropensis]|uniref:hypothetical protein n=1 Tax=Streptomyces bottropensis TaxID=42235 RepID=UPI00368934BC
MSAQEAARYPSLRARLEASRVPKNRAAKPRKAAAPRASSSVYVEWNPAAEIGDARRWVVDLPDTELLNANDRPHWTKRRQLTADIREAAAVLARQQRVPRLNRARVIYVVKPKMRTRVFDPSNWALSAKAAVDGLQDAGVFEDDNAAVVTGVDPRAGERQDGANIRMSLVIVDQGEENEGV